MWLGSAGRHDLPCLHAPRLTPAFTRWALGAGGPSARLLARCPRRLYSELPGCEVRPRGSDNHCRVNTSSISVESISVNPGLAPSPAPSLAAGLRTYPLALGSVPRILGMGKWFWFPDPFGPGTVPFLLTTFPQGLGASGGMPVLVGDDARPPERCTPPVALGWGRVRMWLGDSGAPGLGASFRQGLCPWQSTLGPSWPPHPARKPRGMVGLGEGRGAPGISLLFINHENDSCCLAQA